MSGIINSLLPSQAGLTTGSEGIIELGTGDGVPGGVESIFEYNGSLFNVRRWVDTFIINSIEGLADADVRDSREVNPGRHGETPYEAYYGGRTLVLSGKIRAHTLNKLRDMQMGLKQVFGDISRELPLRIRHPDVSKDLVIYCKKSQPIAMAEVQQNFNFERDFQVTLRASDPFFETYSASHEEGGHGMFETFLQSVEYKGDVNIADNPEWVTDDGIIGVSPGVGVASSDGNSAKVKWTSFEMATGGATARITKRDGSKFDCVEGLNIGVNAVVFTEDWSGGSPTQLAVRLQFYDADDNGLNSQEIGSIASPVQGTRYTISGSWPAPENAAFFVVNVVTLAGSSGIARSNGIEQLTLVINPEGGFLDIPFNGTVEGAWLGAPHESMSIRRSKDGLEAYDKGGTWYSSFAYNPDIYVEGGRLRTYNTDSYTFEYLRKTGEDLDVADARWSIRYKPGATPQQSSTRLDLIIKRIDDDNWLTARINLANSPPTMQLLKWEEPSSTTLASSALAAALLPNEEYKFSIEVTGNQVKLVHQLADGTAVNTLNHTLVGGDATKFGAGAIGRYGFGFWSGEWDDWWFDEHNVEPAASEEAISYTVTNAGNAAARPRFRLHGPLHAATNGGTAADIRASAIFQGSLISETMRLLAPTTSTIAIPENHYIEIDIKARTVNLYTVDGELVRNAFDQLDVSSEWISLRPGMTTITVETTAYGAPRLETIFRHTYF